jgi:hypothetical protein
MRFLTYYVKKGDGVDKDKLATKLQQYEQAAYDDAFLGGSAWLERVGQGFTHYVEHCIEHKERLSISGFVAWIDDMAEDLGLVKQ